MRQGKEDGRQEAEMKDKGHRTDDKEHRGETGDKGVGEGTGEGYKGTGDRGTLKMQVVRRNDFRVCSFIAHQGSSQFSHMLSQQETNFHAYSANEKHIFAYA
jgi:hypothetical protein